MNDTFVRNTLNRAGAKGQAWINVIPSIVKSYEQKWNITVFPPYNLSYNYVAPGLTSTGQPVVLKIGFSGGNEFISEIHALKVFADGAVKILMEDEKNFVVLLQKIEPGHLLKKITNDSEATKITSNIIKKLGNQSKTSYKFKNISDWAKGFERYKQSSDYKIPSVFIFKAREIYKEHISSLSKEIVLHADLHHENILLNNDQWVAVDPKGVIGEPEYEIGSFLRNPYPELANHPNIKEVTQNRIHIFSSELDFDPKRLARWAFAQTVLSAVWVTKDNGKKEYVQYYLKLAGVFLDLF